MAAPRLCPARGSARYWAGPLATVGIALAVLFVLPVAGVYHPVSGWLPSALTDAPAALISGTQHLPHYLPAFAVAVAASGAALAATGRGADYSGYSKKY